MDELPTLDLKGVTGQTYEFTVYAKGSIWNDSISCVYYVSQRKIMHDGNVAHTAIYIGETEDIKKLLANHPEQTCFENYSYNTISVHRESDAYIRKEIVKYLVEGIKPPCNNQSSSSIVDE